MSVDQPAAQTASDLSDKSRETPLWHSVDSKAAVDRLGTDATSGLPATEAESRLVRYGPNVLQATDKTEWHTVLGRQFVDVLIWILLAAAIIAFAIGEVGDAATILAIVALNGALGFIQEIS